MTQPIAVVSGVGAGLGAALCRILAEENYHVVSLARSIEFGQSLAETLKQKHQNLTPLACDLSQKDAIEKTFAYIRDNLGHPDVYIHNVGWFTMQPFLEAKAEDFEKMWRITTMSALLCAQQVIPHMLEQKQGTLLFTGATASLKGSAHFASFAAAKFALRGLVQSLAREYHPQGIHIAHIILDGLIWGEQAKGFGATEMTTMQPEAIAKNYLHLIQQDRSVWTHELDLRPDIEKF